MTRASDLARLIGAGATINDGTTITTADNTSQLILTSTDADSSFGPILELARDSGSPADGDAIGQIKFVADNDAGQATDYGTINGTLRDASDGTEDAQIQYNAMVGGTAQDFIRYGVGSDAEIGVIFNEGSIDADFRVESNNNTHAIFVDGGNDVVGIGTSSPSSFNGGANNLVVGTGSGSEGITIFAANDSNSAIFFADGDSTTTGQINYLHASNAFSFHTNGGNERMRIHSDGTISVGSSNSTGGDQMKIHNVGSGFILNLANDSQSNGCLITAQSGTGTVIHHQINNSNGLVGKIESSGSSTTYATSSDYRLKENVSYNFDATTRLKQLKPARFNFIADETNTLVDGFLAHEVSSVVPEAITGEKDATEKYIDDNGDEQTRIVPQGIDQSKLVPLLVKTIQELESRITTLESK
jgi:hypothetical protein